MRIEPKNGCAVRCWLKAREPFPFSVLLTAFFTAFLLRLARSENHMIYRHHFNDLKKSFTLVWSQKSEVTDLSKSQNRPFVNSCFVASSLYKFKNLKSEIFTFQVSIQAVDRFFHDPCLGVHWKLSIESLTKQELWREINERCARITQATK